MMEADGVAKYWAESSRFLLSRVQSQPSANFGGASTTIVHESINSCGFHG